MTIADQTTPWGFSLQGDEFLILLQELSFLAKRVSPIITSTRALTACLILANPSFTSEELVIPDEVKSKFTAFQKDYLITCIRVPPPLTVIVVTSDMKDINKLM